MRLTESFDIENYGEETDDSIYFSEIKGNQLNNALQEMSSGDRSILELKYNQNLSVKKIESLLGIGESAVKMRIKRAKERLANSFGHLQYTV
jgi:RNA polymerase sigma-70 factor (ECF subfamily)